ncbi:MAG: hypothetical protein FWG14_12790, partial [Peptococcaceae bacterium]|nr:hypothetical protein [Peptococcaceae bacterium]
LEAHNPIESSALNVRPLCVAGFKEQPRVLGYSATTINWYARVRGSYLQILWKRDTIVRKVKKGQ